MAGNRIQWYEGMLLEPQHFQQMEVDLYQRSLNYLQTALPYYWGVRSCTIDMAVLPLGIFRLNAIDAIFPDGTWVQVDNTTVDLPQLNFKSLNLTGVFKIYLGVMRYRPDGANTQGEFPRYDSILSGPIVDENTGEGQVYIPKLAVKVNVLAGPDIPSRYVLLPIAEVFYQEDQYVLTPYIPPQTQVGLDLYKMALALIDQMRQKIHFLASKLQSVTNFSPLIQKYSDIYKTLAPVIPRLEAIIFAKIFHPVTVYVELCAIAGQLTVIVTGQVPPVFSPYNHEDLFQTFHPVITYIQTILEEIQQLSVSIPFQLKDRVFSLQIQPDWDFEGKWILGLTPSPGQTKNALLDWVKGAVIADQSALPLMRDKRILGADRQVVSEIPNFGLVNQPNLLFVTVTQDLQFIKTSGVLSIVNSDDTEATRPLSIVLFIKEAK